MSKRIAAAILVGLFGLGITAATAQPASAGINSFQPKPSNGLK